MWPGIPDSYQNLPESDSGSFRYTRSRDYQTPTRHALLGSGRSWKTNLFSYYCNNTVVIVIMMWRSVVCVCVFVWSVHGQYSSWSSWSECSMTCGDGSSYRTRSCRDPAPANGGRDCRGQARQRKPCVVQECPGEQQQRHYHYCFQSLIHVLTHTQARLARVAIRIRIRTSDPWSVLFQGF